MLEIADTNEKNKLVTFSVLLTSILGAISDKNNGS